MKHLWTAVALLTAMILVFYWNGARLNGLVQPQQEVLDTASQAAKAGQWEMAHELTQRVAQRWKDNILRDNGDQSPSSTENTR
jgi:TRAP-type C4-dicarboxylate transport system substrate-binding protein